jgi:hypothetical protein
VLVHVDGDAEVHRGARVVTPSRSGA